MVKTKPVKQAPPKSTNEIIWGFNATKQEHPLHHSIEWRTICGRYIVSRILSKEEGATPKYAAVRVAKVNGIPQQLLFETELNKEGKARGYYARYYNSLDAALMSVEQYHIKRYGVVTCSNRTELVCHADKQQLAGVPNQQTEEITTPKEKPTKPQVEKRTKSPREVGVIATILECLKGASEKKPITKDEILNTLKSRFPDRDEQGMKSTLNIQVPGGLRSRKGIIVQHNSKGYWLP